MGGIGCGTQNESNVREGRKFSIMEVLNDCSKDPKLSL